MKKLLVALVVVAVAVAVIVAVPAKQTNADFLRIHIRADSNSAADQNIKYAVKSAVVDFLTPVLSTVHSKQQAMSAVRTRLGEIQSVCDKVLADGGFDYVSHAKLTAEQFPDRTYGELTLESGVYDALIIELGSGSGNNWWCVVYPPLCFINGESNGTDKIVYRSKLLQIIEEWRTARK